MPITLHSILYFISAILYGLLLYKIERAQFTYLILLFGGLFAGYFLIIGKGIIRKVIPPFSRNTWLLMIVAAVIFRLIALFSIPNLSDDYYRFIWDGRLLANGENPFLKLPADYMKQPEKTVELGLTQELYNGLNSPKYFTIYPPVNQFIFWLSAAIFPNNINGSIWLMKFFLFCAELVSLYLIYKLLQHYGRPREWLAIYALNPLVIVELMGNLHFEALMICFLLWAIYLLAKGKWQLSSIPYALAICSKLLPIMLMPLLIRRLGLKNTVIFGLLVLSGMIICFLPIFDWDTFKHLGESVGLYFQKFEFNASIYYIVRWIGFQVKGYNIIGTAGKYLAVTTVIGILLITLLELKPTWKNIGAAMMGAFTIYFSMATIVHPWYATTLVALAAISTWRYPIIWTFLLPLTYFTYLTTSYVENLWLVAMEYVVLLFWIIWEVSRTDLSKIQTKWLPNSFRIKRLF